MRTLNLSEISLPEIYDDLPQDFKDCFWSDAELRLKEFKKKFLETCLEQEVEMVLNAGWHERTEERVGFRNGYRVRKGFKAHGFGEIKDFRVPRLRGITYESKILVKYQRRSIKFDYDIMKMYVTSSSTRGIKRIVKQLFGADVSHTTVSTILEKTQKKLDEWRKRKLTKEYEAIVLDGLYINIRTIPKVFKKTFKNSKKRRKDTQGVILAVMGITSDGIKEILGFKIAYSESEAEWFGLLNDLLNRGLSLKQDGVIIHDGSKGLISAIDAAFTYHKKQLCVFHFIQFASSYAKNISQRKLCQKDLSIIYSISKNQKTATKLFFNFISKWRFINPSIASYVRNTFSSTLTYLEFPVDKHKSYSTTNYLERTFKEFNRKTYDVGVFPNVYSAERIVFLLVIEHNFKNTKENPFYA